MIDPVRLQSQLTTDFCGRRLVQFASTDSTNRLLMDWSRREEHCPEGLAVLATQQTAGQGSRGHQWVSSPGGIYLSVLLYPQVNVQQVQALTLAIAWGVALSLRRELGVDVQLKWPNDLVIRGQKLGGILLQTRSAGMNAGAVVAGLGLNVYNPPPEMGVAIADCLDQEIDMVQQVAMVLGGLEMGYQQWKIAGLEGLQPAYESLMAYRNSQVLCDQAQLGRVMGIDTTGLLRVEVNGEEVSYQPGDIHLGYVDSGCNFV